MLSDPRMLTGTLILPCRSLLNAKSLDDCGVVIWQCLSRFVLILNHAF